MTLDEIKALPIGTEVLIRANLSANIPDQDGEIDVGDYGWVTPDQIVSVAPPRSLKVGDKVRQTRAVYNCPVGLTVLAIHDDLAWCDTRTGAITFRLDTLEPA